MNKHAMERFYEGPVWSTMWVGEYGTMIDRVGLTPNQARHHVTCFTYANPGLEMYMVASPSDEQIFDEGPYGVVFLIGGHAYLHAVGLKEEKCHKIAKQAMEDLGPQDEIDCVFTGEPWPSKPKISPFTPTITKTIVVAADLLVDHLVPA